MATEVAAIATAQRKYFPAWEALKKRGTVTLKVAPHLVPRVRKAVIKEKDMDLGYKMQRDEAGQKPVALKSNYCSETWFLRLELREYNKITIYDL